MEQLDWIEPAAQEIGAVNTIVIRDDALQASTLTPLGSSHHSCKSLVNYAKLVAR